MEVLTLFIHYPCDRTLVSITKFERLMVIDPIFFESIRQGNANRLLYLLNMTNGLKYGISPDITFRVGSHDRPAINLAIEAGHAQVG